MTGLIPEILEHLGPKKLTSEHQQLVQYYVGKLHEATGKHQNTIILISKHPVLYLLYKVPRYQDILEEDWLKVENWFRVQIERAKGTSRH